MIGQLNPAYYDAKGNVIVVDEPARQGRVGR